MISAFWFSEWKVKLAQRNNPEQPKCWQLRWKAGNAGMLRSQHLLVHCVSSVLFTGWCSCQSEDLKWEILLMVRAEGCLILFRKSPSLGTADLCSQHCLPGYFLGPSMSSPRLWLSHPLTLSQNPRGGPKKGGTEKSHAYGLCSECWNKGESPTAGRGSVPANGAPGPMASPLTVRGSDQRGIFLEPRRSGSLQTLIFYMHSSL